MALLAAQQDGGAAHKTVLKHMHITVTSSQISPSRLKPFVLKSHWAGPGWIRLNVDQKCDKENCAANHSQIHVSTIQIVI